MSLYNRYNFCEIGVILGGLGKVQFICVPISGFCVLIHNRQAVIQVHMRNLQLSRKKLTGLKYADSPSILKTDMVT